MGIQEYVYLLFNMSFLRNKSIMLKLEVFFRQRPYYSVVRQTI